MAKEPYIHSKEPYIHSKEPYISSVGWLFCEYGFLLRANKISK